MRPLRIAAVCCLFQLGPRAQLLVVNQGLPPGGAREEGVRLGPVKSSGFIGDHFSLGARGEVWIIDSVRIWAAPADDRNLEDLYERLVLFGGIESPAPDPAQPPQPECDCHNLMTIRSAVLTNARRGTSGPGVAVAPAGPRLWQVDFQDLHWSVPGGYPIQYGVMAEPRALPGGYAEWYMRASRAGGPHRLRVFDPKGKDLGQYSAEGEPGPSAGFNVEVRGHKTAPATMRVLGDMVEVTVQTGPMFDARKMDIVSLRFGPRKARPATSRLDSQNGSPAMIVGFVRSESGARSGDLSVCLNGLQDDGVPFEACGQLSPK